MTIKVEVEAKNSISTTTKKNNFQVTVEDIPTKNDKGSLLCDLGQELGKTIKCHGEVNRGSDSKIQVDFGDGFKENLILSKKKKITLGFSRKTLYPQFFFFFWISSRFYYDPYNFLRFCVDPPPIHKKFKNIKVKE